MHNQELVLVARLKMLSVLRSSSRRSKLLAGAVEEPANMPSYIKPILCTQVEVLL